MKQASLIIGIIAIVGMVIGFIPCLGWFNWLNLPIAAVGLVLGIIDYNNARQINYDEYGNPMRPVSTGLPLGIILCAIALVFGFFRLVLGGGII